MKKQLVIAGIILVLIIVAFSGCINVPKESPQFSIVSFNVEPGIINQGELANLSWVVLNASSVNIDNGIGSVALTGYRIIQPTQTTTYILIASNATITKSATAKITVNNESNKSTQPEKTLLTITVGSQSHNYTLNNLTALGSISEYGSYINRLNKTTGPNNYTGVSIGVLLNSLPALPDNFYMLQAIASDGYSRNYSIDEVNGHVTMFNETGGEIGTGNLTMIIAYKENGVLLNETTKGPLRIAFVNTRPTITNSGLWLGSVIKIQIIVQNNQNTSSNRMAIIATTMGTIKVQLYENKMPITTANFIKLASDGFYNGLVFHRVIDNFMIQGGGFYPNGTQKQDSYGTIKLETSPDVLHVDGAISMARLSSPVDSATSQFFICDGAQTSLDGHYAAFGKVIDGMEVVRTIASVTTSTKYVSYENWPVNDVIINSITIVSS